MNKEISNISQLEQEFAYVDTIITAHTNAAVAKVNATAQIEAHPFVQMTSAQKEANSIVQLSIAQLPTAVIPPILCLVTYTHHLENPSIGIILCPSADKAEVEYSLAAA